RRAHRGVDGSAGRPRALPAPGSRLLDVIRGLPAGPVFDGVVGHGQALRIMTGAPMPRGADTVYPQEIVDREGERVRVGPLDKGVNVRRRGEDVTAGTTVIQAGTVLRPQ